MNPTKMSPDDPRLTAYALGELDREESAAIASAIAHDPVAQRAVAEIQSLSTKLEVALANEPIEMAPTAEEPVEAAPVESARIIRFPIYWASGLAACFALLLLMRPSPKPAETSQAIAATTTTAPANVTSASPDAFAAVDVARFRRLPSENVPDIRPAPAVEGGLQLGRTVVSNDSVPGRRTEALSPSRDFGSVRNRLTATSESQEFLRVAGYPLSTITLNGVSNSYADFRAFLQSGKLPPADAVHIGQMLSHFAYAKSAPRGGHESLAASVEVAAAPWNPSHRLVRIGVQGAEAAQADENGDIQLQVEFNPEQAKSYRLLGYEETSGPKLADVGDPTGGKIVTALYEVVPVGAPEPLPAAWEPLRYASESRGGLSDDPRSRELLTLKVQYKAPTVDVSRKLEIPLIDPGTDFAKASKDFKFAAAVAGFGMLLKESPYKGSATYEKVLTWAKEGQDADDPAGRQNEFIEYVKKAKAAVE